MGTVETTAEEAEEGGEDEVEEGATDDPDLRLGRGEALRPPEDTHSRIRPFTHPEVLDGPARRGVTIGAGLGLALPPPMEEVASVEVAVRTPRVVGAATVGFAEVDRGHATRAAARARRRAGAPPRVGLLGTEARAAEEGVGAVA